MIHSFLILNWFDLELGMGAACARQQYGGFCAPVPSYCWTQLLPWLCGFCANDTLAAPSASAPASPSAAASFIINVFMAYLHFADADRRVGFGISTERPAVSHPREIWTAEAVITGLVANGLFAASE
jgi:hypothetical protein